MRGVRAGQGSAVGGELVGNPAASGHWVKSRDLHLRVRNIDCVILSDGGPLLVAGAEESLSLE